VTLLSITDDRFAALDWLVVLAYFAFTTVVGARLAGRQQTIRDFFLGGRKLPWYAVSGSIIATEISAVTFVGVPATVYFGNWTYLQLGFGAILAKIIVGCVFVPAFYEREIYSPYDYMGRWLGPDAKRVTTGLFVVGQLLAQGVRLYLTAMVLAVVSGGRLPLATSVWVIGAVAVGWTLLGGIATVIWTDVLLFLVFIAGGAVSVAYASHLIPGGFEEVLHAGWAAGKFRMFDLSADPSLDFTLWAGLLACTVFNLNMYGTDQLIAQRMFCCRSARTARWAMISSSAGLLVAALMMLVGVALFAYHARFPLSGADAAAVAEQGDRLFPIFIVRTLPAGLTGLLVAGIFAAAISSLDSILAALSQTTVSAVYRPWRQWRSKGAEHPPHSVPDSAGEAGRELRASRLLVVAWGFALCGMAHLAQRASAFYPDILRLALAMAGYTGGALLAGFMLAFLRVRVDGSGLLWAAPVSVLTVFAVAWHQPWSHWVCWIGAGLLVACWCGRLIGRPRPGDLARSAWLLLALGAMLWINHHGYWTSVDADTGQLVQHSIAWPWFVLIGFAAAFPLGYLLGEPRAVQPCSAGEQRCSETDA